MWAAGRLPRAFSRDGDGYWRQGCEELLCATDRWRGIRGLGPLAWENWGLQRESDAQ